MFTPGQPVVCVNGVFSASLAQYFPSLPVEGEMYVIRDIVPGVSPQLQEGEVAVYLVEIIGSISKKGIERGFNAERFAPMNTVPDEEEEFSDKISRELVHV